MEDTRPKTQEKRQRREGDRPNRENRRERPPREPREKVSLETVIPTLPAKSERIKEPNDDEYKKTLVKMDADIDGLHKQLKKQIEDILNAARKERQAKAGVDKPDNSNFQDKIAESKTLNADFKAIRQQFQEKKLAWEDCNNKITKIKDKLKGRQGNRQQLEDELRVLKQTQSEGTVSVAREKEIIKQIAELEKLVPMLAPLDSLQAQLKVIRSEKDVLGKKMNEQWSKLDAVNAEIKSHKEVLDQLKQAKGENSKTSDETQKKIDVIKAEAYAKIDKLKADKQTFKKAHSEQKDKYYEQQEFIQRVEFMKKIKDRLIRDQEREKEYEERRKQREEEEKLIDENPNKEEIDLCILLIDYCQKLQPRRTEETVAQQEVSKVDIEQVLKGNDWKKDNCTAVVQKKDINDDFFVGKAKKNKKQRGPQNKTSEEKTEEILNHKMEVLNFFNEMRIAPPQTLKDLESTVKQLQEKKSYYENLPKDAKKEKPTQNKEQTQSAPKQKKQTKQEFVEAEFPTL